MLARRRFVFEFLEIVRQHDGGYRAARQRDAHGAVNHMAHLRSHARLLHIGAGHVLEH